MLKKSWCAFLHLEFLSHHAPITCKKWCAPWRCAFMFLRAGAGRLFSEAVEKTRRFFSASAAERDDQGVSSICRALACFLSFTFFTFFAVFNSCNEGFNGWDAMMRQRLFVRLTSTASVPSFTIFCFCYRSAGA